MQVVLETWGSAYSAAEKTENHWSCSFWWGSLELGHHIFIKLCGTGGAGVLQFIATMFEKVSFVLVNRQARWELREAWDLWRESNPVSSALLSGEFCVQGGDRLLFTMIKFWGLELPLKTCTSQTSEIVRFVHVHVENLFTDILAFTCHPYAWVRSPLAEPLLFEVWLCSTDLRICLRLAYYLW